MQLLQQRKSQIKEIVCEAQEENEKLHDYQNELQLLLQEKMAHVEELRLIHTDINTMEGVIKQSSTEQNGKMNEACRLFDELSPMKNEIDNLRQEFGLAKLNDFVVEEPQLVEKIYKKVEVTADKYLNMKSHPTLMSTIMTNEQQQQQHQHQQQSNHNSTAAVAVVTDNMMLASFVTKDRHQHTSQPPPMKACLSCHQQIHRNAPICPLCKAKSRSKNPKKPKKQQTKTEE